MARRNASDSSSARGRSGKSSRSSSSSSSSGGSKRPAARGGKRPGSRTIDESSSSAKRPSYASGSKRAAKPSGSDEGRGSSSSYGKRPSAGGFRKEDKRDDGKRASYGKRPFGNSSRKDDGAESKRPYARKDSSADYGASKRSSYSKSAGTERGGERKSRSEDGRTSSYGKRPFAASARRNERSDEGQRPSAGKRPYGGARKDEGDRENKRPYARKESAEGYSDNKRPPSFSREKRSENFGKPYVKTPNKVGKPVGKRYSSKREKEPAKSADGKIRLNKFIANSGICSRREADELITMGLISVNGKAITELGYRVNPTDEIRYETKVLRPEKPVYILMNKPKGFITTTSDPQERKTVMHLVANTVKERVYPVGRLDRNTTGLLLLTNDGELADKLMHPSYSIKKIYKVELDRPLTKADAQQIMEGVRLEEGRAVVDDLAIVSDDGKTVGIEVHIGWNRVVRRIFEALEYEVVKLDRTLYAGLDKKNLGRGEWRFLTPEEIIRIKHQKS